MENLEACEKYLERWLQFRKKSAPCRADCMFWNVDCGFCEYYLITKQRRGGKADRDCKRYKLRDPKLKKAYGFAKFRVGSLYNNYWEIMQKFQEEE